MRAQQIAAADVVLMVCTKTYHRRVSGDEERGKGSASSGKRGSSASFSMMPAPSATSSSQSSSPMPRLSISTPIKGWTRYVVDTPDGYEELYRRLTGQPRLLRPVRALPLNLDSGRRHGWG